MFPIFTFINWDPLYDYMDMFPLINSNQYFF